MAYHIYLYTPLNELSDYFPHLLEHVVLWGISNGAEYFKTLTYSAESYTYYSCFTIDSDSSLELEAFCKLIRKDISPEVVTYESKVLRKELQYPKYFQSLISKIGKQLYWKKFRYSESERLDRTKLSNYHKKYYSEGNFMVLERDLIQKDIYLKIFKYTCTFGVRNNREKETVLVGEYSAEGLFVNELLQDLMDGYMEFQGRYQNWEYFSNETLAGEFDDCIFLSIPDSDCSLLCSIPDDFIEAFMKYNLLGFDNAKYRDIDGPLLVKYGYGISEKSKKEMIEGVVGYYKELKEILMW